MSRVEVLNKIQTACGYVFKNSKLLEEALTHDSNRVNDRAAPNYQRLEFLGDSVLNFVISDYLYRKHPEYREGQLTTERIKLTESLKQTSIAEQLNLREHILFGQSVRKEDFSRCHSFVESLIGAAYIDGGLDAAKAVIGNLWKLENATAATNAASNCALS